MNRVLKGLLVCVLAFTAIFGFLQNKAVAGAATNIDLGSSTDRLAFDFYMPKDGKVKINATVKDYGSVPGILTISIQKEYSESAEKVKEITGITENSPAQDVEVELKEGTYYIAYKLTSATGDLKDTGINVKCTAEILPTVVQNISELTVNSAGSFKDITNKGYDVLKFGDGAEDTDIIIPFTVKNGNGVYISLGAEGSSFDTIEGLIYKDRECTKAVGKSFILDSNSIDKFTDYVRTLTGKGTYYIKFTIKQKYYGAVGEIPFLVKLYDLNGNDRAIAAGKSTLSYQDKASKKISYKITVKSKGILAVDVTPFDNSKGGDATFNLLDKNKKAISKSSKMYSYQKDNGEFGATEKVYTVPAGIYYVQVTASSNLYQLDYIVYDKLEKNAGSSKAKAKVLKVQQTIGTGNFTYADKTSAASWYKFTLTEDQYAQLYMLYNLDGDFEIEIQDAKGRVLYKNSKELGTEQGNYELWYGTTYKKGTYYIKIYKKGSLSSVAYQFALYNYEYKTY